MSPLRQPAIIVLAAGMGPRVEAPNGKWVRGPQDPVILCRTLQNAVSTGFPVVAVTRPELMGTVSGIVASKDIVILPAGTEGSSSDAIAAGVSMQPDATGWVVLPSDLPLIKPSSLLQVADALRLYPAVYAQYGGLRGHPVGFSSELYSELVVLRGDEGARRLLARYPAYGVEVDDSGVLLDADTQADLYRLRQRAQASRAAGFTIGELPKHQGVES